ncbi:hypothetical protein HNP46_000293 [Pseudomonas nitritireducens]|uniref:Uncharacterized protein n=1 Tax=Pseudomonas nitroreducens TaxID=46680 RepID=A0A7W7KEP4_PSENT|nr:hypothetical protein [Pseudomonas nitritireducens]MBB4861482.1 hypothetical protein [Pseudomonas nitritireducens]
MITNQTPLADALQQLMINATSALSSIPEAAAAANLRSALERANLVMTQWESDQDAALDLEEHLANLNAEARDSVLYLLQEAIGFGRNADPDDKFVALKAIEFSRMLSRNESVNAMTPDPVDLQKRLREAFRSAIEHGRNHHVAEEFPLQAEARFFFNQMFAGIADTHLAGKGIIRPAPSADTLGLDADFLGLLSKGIFGMMEFGSNSSPSDQQVQNRAANITLKLLRHEVISPAKIAWAGPLRDTLAMAASYGQTRFFSVHCKMQEADGMIPHLLAKVSRNMTFIGP